MDEKYLMLTVNTGSTSTKVALFENDREIFKKTVEHDPEVMQGFQTIQDQLPYRKDMVAQAVVDQGYALEDIPVFVARGGGTQSVIGGTYTIDELLVSDARIALPGQHPSQLGSQICWELMQEYGGDGYVVNPPNIDEFQDLARVTGLKDVFRESHNHALNQKEMAHRYCKKHGTRYEDNNFIITHIGGGVSVTAHRKGRMVDSCDIIGGEGPMAPNRVGTLTTKSVVDMCFSGKYTEKQVRERLVRKGGFIDHLGTEDAREIERRICEGDKYAELIYNALIYQVAKYIGYFAPVLKGQVDAIIVTGGLANSQYLTTALAEYVDWIAPVEVMAGEFEMEALASGTLRVLTGQEQALKYPGKPHWNGFEF